MFSRYLIRIDDACPTMDWDRFSRLHTLLNHFSIRPIIGIIPENADPKLEARPVRAEFWNDMRSLHAAGWIIAQHGFRHEYVTQDGGILNINDKSEFAGLAYDDQYEKIRNGKELLKERIGATITWWMAPAHSLDRNTCRALQNLGFTHITDGIALFPFRKYGLTWVPQQLWQPTKKYFGLWTLCLHPDTLDDALFKRLERFLEREHRSVLDPTNDTVTQPRTCLLNMPYFLWWKFQYLIYKTFFK